MKRDFPGGLVIQTPQFHCTRHRFNPWSRKFLIVKEAAKKEKNKKRWGWRGWGENGGTSREVESVLSVKPKGKQLTQSNATERFSEIYSWEKVFTVGKES